ncbi:MAG: hypothetical protein MJA29_13345 [Candidatus Omnitrophica bacterium]|nr:hypothetical protein [Candidatus Omnitrophota bacterium]
MKWDRFVANRVSEIQKLTDIQCWSHCPGEMNPADLVTRGISAGKLISSKLWMQGPTWLSYLSLQNMTSDLESLYSRQLDSECDISDEVALVSVTVDPSHPFPFERWGSYGKVVRIVAYVLRLISNMRSSVMDRNLGEVSQEEFDNAEMMVFFF